jgi:hypothetical protein
MKKLELLKKMIANINNSEEYKDTVFQAEDMFFVISDNKILAIYEDGISGYFIPNYTEEELKEVKRIEKELDLDYMVFLPCKGDAGCCLDDLIECYENNDKEDKVEQIENLLDVLSDERSMFFNREEDFLSIFLYPELQSGVPYVHRDWDHDEAYYYGLDYSIGVCDPLYDVIVEKPDFVYPDYIEDYDDRTEQENECDRWIEILSEIDKHIVK